MLENIVSVAWLKDNLHKEDIIVLDTSFVATAHRVIPVCKAKVIPTAKFFDLKLKFSNKESELPNMFPSIAQFQKESRELGINNTSHIIVYDNLGIYTSPRVWWMFKALGHKKVSVLDGGLPEWINKGYPTEKFHNKEHSIGNFRALKEQVNIKSYDDIVSNISEKKMLLIDARSNGRFVGTEDDPRKNLKSGHIPNAINIHYKDVLQENGTYKNEEDLIKIFKNIKNQDIVFSCGSGITACIVLLASEKVLKNNKYIYDGSWTEWAERQGLFKA